MSTSSKFQSNSLESKDISFQLHPYTDPNNLKEHGPQIITGGEGIRVQDADGKSYIEGMSGLWCASLGFSENELVEAAIKQMKILPFYHSFSGKGSNPSIQLAEKLISVAPRNLEKVFFCNSGSEANDTAIKLIWYYHAAIGMPAKRKVISRIGGYHGVTLAAASLTALPYAQDGFSLPLEFALHTSSPHFFQHSLENESESEFVDRLALDLEKLIENEGSENIGGFIAEPVMGAGGVITPPKGYFEKIIPILKRHKILLIADEVICGFGRTANMWGSETYEIIPDILTCAKGLSSAYAPISAVLISREIIEKVEEQANRLGQFGHGFTYSGHPVSAAVALRTIELMEERNIIEHVKDVSPYFSDRLRGLEYFKCVGEARSVGLIGAIEFVAKPKTNIKINPKHKFSSFAAKIIQDNGVILRSLPIDGIGFCPPLITTENEIKEMFDKIEMVMPQIDHHLDTL